jgi:copper chaperone CopZ
MDKLTYSVPGMSCSHCEAVVKTEVSGVPGVSSVEVDLEAKLVTVRGTGLDDGAIRHAIDEAGYDVG